MPQSITYKLLRGASSWYLVAILGVLQAGCLPDSSKEIDKVRARDNSRKNYWEKSSAFENNIIQTKQKITSLTDKSLKPIPSNKAELTETCKEFLQEKYLPYLQAEKEYLAHLVRCESDTSKKRQYTADLQHTIRHLSYVEKLLRRNDLEELCKFIINNIKISN